MPRSVYRFVLALFFVAAWPGVLLNAPFAYGQPAPVSFIVRLAPTAPPALQQAARQPAAKTSGPYAALTASVIASAPLLPEATPRPKTGGAGWTTVYTLTVPDSSSLARVLPAWQATDGVSYAHPNVRYRLEDTLPPEPLADSLDHLDVTRTRAAWPLTTGRASVQIGVVDTGIWPDHPDLDGQFAINPGEDVNGNGRFDAPDRNGIDDDGNGWVDDVRGYDFVDQPGTFQVGEYTTRDPDAGPDPDGGGFARHGTEVAGIIGAARNGIGMAGVAPGTRLLPLRAFSADGFGETDDIAAAIVYATERGVDVLNFSFGRRRPTQLLEDAIAYAINRGVVVVASAGNSSGDEPHYPSDYPGVISVPWLTEDGQNLARTVLQDLVIIRGQYGNGLDVGAPGTRVFTTLLPPDLNASSFADEELFGALDDGSSFAAPQVAGAAGLLRSVDSTLTPASIQNILTGTATDLRTPGWDYFTGSGLLNVEAALADALPAQTALLSPAHNAGVAAGPVPIVGTVLDPGFTSYEVSYAVGTLGLDQQTDPWTVIATGTRQALRDTLAQWRIDALPDTSYTLRLVVRRRSGRALDNRRRVFIDRTAPQLTLRAVTAALHNDGRSVVADVATDDRTTVTMRVQTAQGTGTEASEFLTTRHGLAWPLPPDARGAARVTLTATNTAGATTTATRTVPVPTPATNTALLTRTETRVPRGRLLPFAPDFDGDALPELVFNQYAQGGLGDTLKAFEWTGSGFQPADALVANVIPRDTGDTDADGRAELLTQIAGVTLLLERNGTRLLPAQQAFLDTTGLANPSALNALIGARLGDFDGDGRGAILGNNQSAWRVLERTPSGTFRETTRLTNPTAGGSTPYANQIGNAAALTGDLDGDGRIEALFGDGDGDWFAYEWTGNNTATHVWSYPTDGFFADDRFAQGETDGDAGREFVTFTGSFPLSLDEGAQAPPLSRYYIWQSTGDNAFAPEAIVPVYGARSGNGSVAMGDLDGDGTDEVIISHPPYLYVLDREPDGSWQRIFVDGAAPEPVVQSRSLVVHDFDGDGRASIVAMTSDDTFARYVPQPAALERPPPRWRAARAVDATSLRLSWTAPGADSVTVLTGPIGGTLNRRASTTDSTLVLSETATRRYALRAWQSGTASPLSPARVVRPHAPATVAAIEYPTDTAVRLTFTEPLAAAITAPQFTLDAQRAPTRLLRADDGRAVVLRFEALAPGSHTLRWTGVRDTSGVPVAQTEAVLAVPAPQQPPFIVKDWTVTDPHTVQVTFSAPLRPAQAERAARYRLEPVGTVTRAALDAANPARLSLTVAGTAIGATGRTTTLVLDTLQAATGARLAEESRRLRLTQFAETLANAYVYPNPYRAARHSAPLIVAGVPRAATVRIYTASGQLVRVVRADGTRVGGVAWDLRDRRGQRVPSGVYLLRIEAPDTAPVLRKAAVIR
ncbi:S8 family serine peptidase [Salisaeta longa]|uniref:S8 family serine peptidase n=1 Tax=Salisaeta longa TaxID=503170 RepID=UPI001B7FCA1F|nr:S8 family serine peptidase [Salisaeta longa]